MTAVLEGVRVLDFGRFIAGPFCAALLGDLGADVIRIERVDGGEDRVIASVGSDAVGAVYLQSNRNKRGLTLNPATPEGREITRRLVEGADVVVANFPAKALKSLGLDYDRLRDIKPDIILTTVNAFGAGPWENKIGFDGLAQAMSGNLHLSGDASTPTRAFTAYADFGTASLCAMSTLAALMHKRQTGEGQLVEGALLKTALTFMSPAIVEQQQLGLDREATLNLHPYSGPSDVFATRDGWVMTMVLGNFQFERWCRLVGAEAWLDDPCFATDQLRGENGADLSKRMSVWCAERTTAEVLEATEQAKVPAGPVYSPRQVLDDPHIQQLDFFEEHIYPTVEKPVLVPGFPVNMSKSPGVTRRRAPELGEHTDEILAELGYTAQEIGSLRERGII
jgi:crotonobetainyl-CoA:carnitine CoA-transferase CaiB-like acyl-CoA transferase